jgi:hypothetical protein
MFALVRIGRCIPRYACFLAVVSVVVLGSLGAQTARAAVSPFQWGPGQEIAAPGAQVLTQMSCPPASSLCVGIDNFFGDVVTSTNPTGGAAAWTAVNIDGRSVDAFGGSEGVLTGISCPSATLCVVVDQEGNALVSTNPAGGIAAWSKVRVVPESVGLESVSCPSSALCVAVDSTGDVVTSTNPTGGAGAWSVTGMTTSVSRVSCPTVSLCVATNGHGKIVTTTEPTAGTSAWNTAEVDGDNRLTAISCASIALCVATDGVGNVVTSTHPTGGAGEWTVANVDGSEELAGVSCPSDTLCIAEGFFKGDIVSSEDPGGGASEWKVAHVTNEAIEGVACRTATFCVATRFASVLTATEPAGEASAWASSAVKPTTAITDIACSSQTLCVAVDAGGHALTSTNPSSSPSTWSSANLASPSELSGIACPTGGSLCVIVGNGRVLTSTNPSGGAGTWKTLTLPIFGKVSGISCPSASFCAAVTEAGEVLTSSEPTGDIGAWHVVTGVDVSGVLKTISCSGPSMCAAGDVAGDIVTSTDPSGSANEWLVTELHPANGIADISCPTSSLCVAVNGGEILSSANPTGGAGAWTSAPITSALNFLKRVSCPSVTQCVVTDGFGKVYTASEPTGGAAAWTVSPTIDFYEFGLGPISCASDVFCVVADGEGDVVAGSAVGPVNISPPTITGRALEGGSLTEAHGSWTKSPTSYAYEWRRCDSGGNTCSKIAGATAQTYSLSASDVGHTIRVAETASNGEGTSRPATSFQTGVVNGPEAGREEEPPTGEEKIPGTTGGGTSTGSTSGSSSSTGSGSGVPALISSAQLTTQLRQQLAPSGSASGIAALLRRGGLTIAFEALEAGTVIISWYELPPGAKVAKAKAKPVLVASGRGVFTQPGSAKLNVRLTSRGMRLLKHASRLKLTGKATFTPTGGSSVSATKMFLLTRRK